MARVSNPFGYADPTAEIGHNLGRALFGDPRAAAQQAAQEAEMDQRRAAAEADRERGGYYRTQADGQRGQNTASAGLPELMASFAPLPGETPDAAFRRALPGAVALIGQAQGDKIDTPKTIGSLASFLGGDEMARRGLVAQGNSPTAAFALTPERADAIAAQDDRAKIEQALGVAQINNRDDIPVAQIKAGADVNVAGINHASDIPVANIRAASRSGGSGKGKAPAAAKPPRMISAANLKAVDDELTAQLDADGLGKHPAYTNAVRNMVRSRAVRAFQRTGDPVGAAAEARASVKIAKKGGGGAKRLTPEQARNLPKGTRFIGTDGVERIRQ